MSEDDFDDWGGLKTMLIVMGCVALSEFLGVWLPKPAAQGLGFFLVPLASYKFGGVNRRMSFGAWSVRAGLFGLGVAVLQLAAPYLLRLWARS